jgi:hypothetical protein
MTTFASHGRPTSADRAVAVSRSVVTALYAVGGLLLAAEAAVHIQQYVAIFHEVRWIGPLFLANAAASAAAMAGLLHPRTRRLAAAAGIAISALALAGLVLSYAVGLFGWTEAGLRTPVAITLAAEAGAVIVLGAALATTTAVDPQS